MLNFLLIFDWKIENRRLNLINKIIYNSDKYTGPHKSEKNK